MANYLFLITAVNTALKQGFRYGSISAAHTLGVTKSGVQIANMLNMSNGFLMHWEAQKTFFLSQVINS